jgi:DNA-binding transcriptional regulator YbjK
MLGAYWESGDPEKMAMFKLQEVRLDLDSLVAMFYMLADGGEGRQKIREGWAKGTKEGFEKRKDEIAARLESVLSELGLAVPRTYEEAKVLRGSIVSFENLQKLAEVYKKKSR